MSWNSPQTITEALKSVRAGFSFHSKLGVKGEPIWVLTDVSKYFHKTDEFSTDLVRRNMEQKNRYLTSHVRAELPEDLVYVVGRDGVALVGMLRNGTILTNDKELPKRLQTFRDGAVGALMNHVADKGHLTRVQ